MAKKRYAVVASFAAACMMVAGFGIGSANAAEVSTANPSPGPNTTTQTIDMSSDGAAVANPSAPAAPVAGPQSNGQSNPLLRSADSSPAAQDTMKVSNVKVTDVGTHTANLSFDYDLKMPANQVNDHIRISPIISFTNVSSLTPRSDKGGCFDYTDWQTHKPVSSCSPYEGDPMSSLKLTAEQTANLDSNLTAEKYQKGYGANPFEITGMDGKKAADAYGQYFERFITQDGEAGLPYKASGHMDFSLIGLEPNTTYSNRNTNANGHDLSMAAPYTMLGEHAKELIKQGKKDQPVKTDIMQLLVGMEMLDFEMPGQNGNWYTDGMPIGDFVQIPAFTTKSLPQMPADGDLNTGNMNDIAVAGKPTAGSPTRLYINHLAAACKANVDGDNTPDCFWGGYIYSNPVALQEADGAPYLQVKKDSQGRYYVDALLPKGYTGDHKIALVDQDGNLQGWTPITFGKDYGQKPVVLPAPAGTPAPPVKPAAPTTEPAAKAPAKPAVKPAVKPVAKPAAKASVSDPKLARTGASVAGVLLAAFVALFAGVGLSLARRRQV